ncbi:O-antigen ligase family protein [Tepidiforma flava]|uniref:O-antigen ligase family protein n=1 Tax=Tepidiforma flava TaxID=3004094 RepID=A0ABY7M6E6_9CHLR|nr:O-antigen ligase family protein [Tepidiforma flava]WBL36111.1 O-antigen ligase family protein [Tepidiforma flava]
MGRWRVFAAGFAGLAMAFAYTAVQAAGLDPFDWWIDTSDRAIGTIGNANELAAFAVISMGLAAFVPERRFALAAAVTWGAALFIVLEAESRSGLAAVALFFVLLPAARWLAGRPGRPMLRAVPAVAGALVLVTAASLAAGGLEGTAARVSGQATAAEHGGSTRLALWEGTLQVVAARPLTGVGPDGLHLGFPGGARRTWAGRMPSTTSWRRVRTITSSTSRRTPDCPASRCWLRSSAPARGPRCGPSGGGQPGAGRTGQSRGRRWAPTAR